MVAFPFGPLQIVEVMDQIHPSARERLMDDRVKLARRALLISPRNEVDCSLHGLFLFAGVLLANHPLSVRFRAERTFETCIATLNIRSRWATRYAFGIGHQLPPQHLAFSRMI